jgi:hypothetical protein
MPTAEVLKQLPVFEVLEEAEFAGLMLEKVEKLVQKD